MVRWNRSPVSAQAPSDNKAPVVIARPLDEVGADGNVAILGNIAVSHLGWGCGRFKQLCNGRMRAWSACAGTRNSVPGRKQPRLWDRP